MAGDSSSAELQSIALGLELPANDPNDSLRQAIAAVDSVHRIGRLPAIPVVWENLAFGEGYFEVNFTTQQPVKIALTSESRQPEWTLVHEIGHFLDYSGFGARGAFASPSDRSFGSWRAAVEQSEAVRQVHALRADARDALRWRALTDLLSYHELWARSYVQYIASKSNHPRLLTSLEARRNQQQQPRYLPRQWDDEDFAPIVESIDTLFRRTGWSR